MGTRSDASDLLLFPQRIRLVDVPEDRVSAILEVLYNDATAASAIALAAAAGSGARVEALPASDRYLFVCIHGARDDRCGQCRHTLLPALRTSAASASTPIRVWGTSHIGGHVHAGNVMSVLHSPRRVPCDRLAKFSPSPDPVVAGRVCSSLAWWAGGRTVTTALGIGTAACRRSMRTS